MLIQSSSLTFSHVGSNRPEGGRVENAPKKNEGNELSVSKASYKRKFNEALAPIYSPEEIKQKLDVAGLDINITNSEPNYIPSDVRILKALNTYNNAINQPLQDQRSELIAGIDFYA